MKRREWRFDRNRVINTCSNLTKRIASSTYHSPTKKALATFTVTRAFPALKSVKAFHRGEKFSTQLTCHHIGSNPFISLLPHSSQCFVLHQGKKKIVVKLLSSQKVCCQLLTLRTLPKRCLILISFQKILASFDQWPRHRYPSSFRYSDGP